MRGQIVKFFTFKHGFPSICNQVRLPYIWGYRLRCYSQSSQNINLLNTEEVMRYLKQIELEYGSLKDQSSERFVKLTPIVNLLRQRGEFENELKNLESLSAEDDTDMKKLVCEEKCLYVEKINAVNEHLLDCLMPNDQVDRDIILEVTAGVGGKEAMLFAGELVSMYEHYASYKGWDWYIGEKDDSEEGGVRHSSTFISGPGAMSCLSQEVGVHRVQRIPATEKSGRVHTSTVAVSVLMQPTDVEIILKDKDLKFETKTSSGAGGQHVNKTESCVRVTHLPTGLVVENQTDRSQIRNRQIALQRLRTKLYQMEQQGQFLKSKAAKKEQVGSSMRSEKVRTYNYSQDRITDHRVGVSLHNMGGFLAGRGPLDDLIAQLRRHRQRQDFLHHVTQHLSRQQ